MNLEQYTLYYCTLIRAATFLSYNILLDLCWFRDTHKFYRKESSHAFSILATLSNNGFIVFWRISVPLSGMYGCVYCEFNITGFTDVQKYSDGFIGRRMCQ